jgi:hypothetical protein
VKAVVYVPRTRVVGDNLPEWLGQPDSLYRHFRRWSQQGVWDELFEHGGSEDELETVMAENVTIAKAQRTLRQGCPRRR